MNTDATVEQQLRSEIERLRGRYPETQDLYREVCVLMFFRYGITPTANKLYQLVRKGSMTAPAEALSRFWDNLREKSRLRIEHPDLPESLKTAAGELTATLWANAQAIARENLDAFQSEAQASVAEAKQSADVATQRMEVLEREITSIRAETEQANSKIADLDQQLALEKSAKHAADAQLTEARRQHDSLQSTLESARRDFSVELDKLRQALALAEERYQASERRALMEIDRERAAATRIQEELELSRAAAIAQATKHREELTAVQEQVSVVRQQLGVLEGSLSESRTLNGQLSAQLEAARRDLTDTTAHMTAAKAEATTLRLQLEEIELRARARQRTKRQTTETKESQ